MPAFASATYPLVLFDQVPMPCEPPCTVCHDSLQGGAGTVVTDLGHQLVAKGLTGGARDDLLAEALVDADDGDLELLTLGLDPQSQEAVCDVLLPTYGCHTTSWSAGSPGLLALASLVLLRRALRCR